MENMNKEFLGDYFVTGASSALSGVTETSGTEMESPSNFTSPYQGHPLNSSSTELVPAFNFPSSYQAHPLNNLGISYPSILDGSPIAQPISHREIREQNFLQACKRRQQQQQQQQSLVAANSQLMSRTYHPSVPNNSDSDSSAQMHKKPRLELSPNVIYNREVIRQSQAMMQRMLREKQIQLQMMQQRNYEAMHNVPSGPSLMLCNSGVCSRRLMQYMYHLRLRPPDNNILYWRKFVAEYYAPCAKKRWCFSLYDHVGPHVLGVFPKNAWLCGICGSKPGRGLEAFFEVLPRLKKINFESGLMDELLYLDMPQEYKHPSGLLVLEYGRAVHESVYEQLRVVRQGKLRVIFTHELKILSWEFCSRNHEELISRRSVAPEVNHLILAALKQQSFARGSRSGGPSLQDLEVNCQMFAAAGRQLARNLESQLVDDLGFSKRFIRCLQISEVVNSLKDLMTSSIQNNIGPIESLQNYAQDTTSNANKMKPMLEKEQLIAEHDDGKESPSSSSEDAASYNLLKQRISNMDMSMAAKRRQESSHLSYSVNNDASSSSLNDYKSSSTRLGSGLSSSHSSSGGQNLQQYSILQEMINSSNLGNLATMGSIESLYGPGSGVRSSAASATVLRSSAVGGTDSLKASSSSSNNLVRNSGSFIKREPSSPEENQLPEVISDVSRDV